MNAKLYYNNPLITKQTRVLKAIPKPIAMTMRSSKLWPRHVLITTSSPSSPPNLTNPIDPSL